MPREGIHIYYGQFVTGETGGSRGETHALCVLNWQGEPTQATKESWLWP